MNHGHASLYFSTLVVCIALGAVQAPAASASTRYVSTAGLDAGDCTSPCRTIGYALTQAASGDSIQVASGTYTESVLLTKRIALVGHGATIDASGFNNGIVIMGDTSDGSSVSGFTVENALLEGILAVQTDSLSIDNNHLIHNDALWDPNNVPLPCQKIDDCGEALHLLSVSRSIVRGNLIEQNVGGILLTDEMGPTHDNTIRDNQVLNNDKDCGITLASHFFSLVAPATPSQGGVYSNRILNNTSNGNGAAGIGVFAGPPGAAAYKNVVEGNTAMNNGLPGVAIHSHAPFQYVNDNVIVNNVLSNNGEDDDAETEAPTGITIFSGVVPIEHTTISANRISDEHYGIFIVKAPKVSGLPSNQFESVSVPVFGN